MKTKTSNHPELDAMLASLDRVPELPPIEIPALPGPPPVPIEARRTKRAHSRRALLTPLVGAAPKPSPRLAAAGGRFDPVLALVNRITQGFNLAEYRRAKALGFDAYLEEQLDHLSINDSGMNARLANFPTTGMSPKDLIDTYPLDPGIPFYELKGATIVRSVHSKRQLFERMCEFWSDHFSIDHQKAIMWSLKPEDDRNVIRQYALSTFPQLLVASAHSGAMMYYLDNYLNFVGLPQENWARELMELHTLGVNGGYTEQDVKEVAKAFTGWSLEFDPASPDYLRFAFYPTLHEPGAKTVLGNTIPASSGKQGGEQVLSILASHPSTALFISEKLIRWLLTENPPQSLINAVAQTYGATGGDIKAMIRVILTEENLQAAAADGPKFRRPFHFVTSILRGLDAEVYDPQYLIFFLMTMGHAPFDWHPPNGYPDSVYAWGNSLLPRWSFASVLMANVIPGVQVSLGELLELLGNFDANGLALRIDNRILGRALAPDEVPRVQNFLDARAPLLWPEVYEAIGLAASGAGYQWY